MTSWRQLRPGGSTILDAAVVVALTSLALLAFRSSYGGIEFLLVGVVACVLGIAVAHVGHALRLPLVVTAALAFLVYVVAAAGLALRDLALAGAIPGPSSVSVSVMKVVTGWKELITTAPPVGNTGDLLVLPVFCGMVAGFTAFTLARRVERVAFALAPFAVVLGLGIATGVDEPVSVVLNGAVLAVVAFGWLAWREHVRRPLLEGVGIHRRQLASGVVLLSVAGATGVMVGPALPMGDSQPRTIWRDTVMPPFDPREYPSPLAGYREYVKRGDDEPDPVMFTIEGLPEGVPVRLATMDEHDGLVWRVSGGDPDDPSLEDSGSFRRVGTTMEPDVDGELADVVVTVGEYSDVWIPDVGEVVSLRFTGSAGGPERDRELAESFRYNTTTDTSATVLRLREGDRYEMTVRLPATVDELTEAPIVPTVQRIGAVRSNLTGQVTQALIDPVLLSINDVGERLEHVRELMTTTGAYSDGDIAAGQIRARAGHSAARLTEFAGGFPATPLVGNAEQYAATYALLFRDLGRLPTRVVMGFLPDGDATEGPVEVLASHAEAWVEVPVRDLGWVGIFPTPPRDQTAAGATAPQQPEPDYRTQNPPPPPLIDPEFDQPATASGEAKPTKEADEEPEGAVGADDPTAPDAGAPISGVAVVVASVAAFPVVLFAVFAGVVVAVKEFRRRRRRSRGPAHQRVASGWLEVRDLAVDLGRPVPSATTRREAATFVGSASLQLAERTDEVVWGGVDLSDRDVDRYWSELRVALGSLRSEVGVLERVRARISLRSLRRSHDRIEREER